MLKSEFIEKIKRIQIDTFTSKYPPNTEKEIKMYNGTDLEDRVVTNVLTMGDDSSGKMQLVLTCLYSKNYNLKIYQDNDLNLRHKFGYENNEIFNVNIKEGFEIIDDVTNEVLKKKEIEKIIKDNTEILTFKFKGIEI